MRLAAVGLLTATAWAQAAEVGPSRVPECPAKRDTVLAPSDPSLCAGLEAVVRNPSSLPLDQYERKLDLYFANYCHRNKAAGWRRDKRVRDTGPFVSTLTGDRWMGSIRGVHTPVMIWYSPEMIAWLERARPAGGEPVEPAPAIPAGAIMVKEMFSNAAGDCRGVDPLRLFPTAGATIMVRDPGASYDGWFWGWYGFGPESGWAPDWPPGPTNTLPNMGFAQYCLNCHASALDNQTFASLQNVEGYPGEPLVFLSQSAFAGGTEPSHHEEVNDADADLRVGKPRDRPDDAVVAALRVFVRDMPAHRRRSPGCRRRFTTAPGSAPAARPRRTSS